uniref:Uncharacterized protein n=1 Tax=Attheya septentrionalis TaxID=420275 RepID=A0A7S2UPK7_9STRA|mmetsp:Transcript_5244/g.9213  ORF Transcript_5244/g.9213 Transcript_5244/m.9213 type:complete len:509 (+) Transcript_5244:240-1766(+)
MPIRHAMTIYISSAIIIASVVDGFQLQSRTFLKATSIRNESKLRMVNDNSLALQYREGYDEDYYTFDPKLSFRTLFHDYAPRASIIARTYASYAINARRPSSLGGFFSGVDFFDSYDEEDQEEKDLIDCLSYLPSGGLNLPPKSRDLLARATMQYLRKSTNNGQSSSADGDVKLSEVLSIIDEEFKFYNVPFSVGDPSHGADRKSKDKDDLKAAEISRKIFAFSAFYRLPREITTVLFGEEEYGLRMQRVAKYYNDFVRWGWKGVLFPKGLGVRIRRKYLESKRARYSILPRLLKRDRNEAIQEAELAIKDSSSTDLPVRRMSREEFLATMDKELSFPASDDDNRQSLFKVPTFFFPNRNNVFKRIKRQFDSQTNKLKGAGRAGVIAYGALNFAWYTLAVMWQWGRVSSAPVSPGTIGALKYSIKKFGKVLIGTYVGSQVTKLARLSLAVLLAPIGDRALRSTQKKFNINESRAFWLLTTLLIGSCLGVWTSVIVGDAALSSVGTFSM